MRGSTDFQARFSCPAGDGVLDAEVRPFGHFAFLLQGVEKMIFAGKPTWPVERTLLTTGILDAAFQSRHQGGERLGTPHLNVRYELTFTWKDPGPPPPGGPFRGSEVGGK